MFLDNQAARDFLRAKRPRALQAFDIIQPGAFKADLLRYAWLAEYGGVYADIEMMPLLPMDRLVHHNASLVVVRDLRVGNIYNAFMAAEPGHPVIERSLEIAIDNIMQRRVLKSDLNITGPGVLGAAFREWHQKVEAPGVQPTWQWHTLIKDRSGLFELTIRVGPTRKRGVLAKIGAGSEDSYRKAFQTGAMYDPESPSPEEQVTMAPVARPGQPDSPLAHIKRCSWLRDGDFNAQSTDQVKLFARMDELIASQAQRIAGLEAKLHQMTNVSHRRKM